MEHLNYFAAFMVGFLGGVHCIGMCGGVIGALTMAIDQENQSRRLCILFIYNLSRIFSYVLIAVLFFLLADELRDYLSLFFTRVFAGFLLIAMGLYLADWWRGLTLLEKGGAIVWRRIQPLSKFFIPVKTAWQACFLGVIWGWLPCGLIYTALVYSAIAEDVSHAALTMLSFGLGTLPATFLSGLLAEQVIGFVRKNNIKVLMALLLITFGLWTIYHGIRHVDHAPNMQGNEFDNHKYHYHLV